MGEVCEEWECEGSVCVEEGSGNELIVFYCVPFPSMRKC